MKKVIASIVAVMFVGSMAFAQTTTKTTKTETKAPAKTETKTTKTETKAPAAKKATKSTTAKSTTTKTTTTPAK